MLSLYSVSVRVGIAAWLLWMDGDEDRDGWDGDGGEMLVGNVDGWWDRDGGDAESGGGGGNGDDEDAKKAARVKASASAFEGYGLGR